MEGVLVNYKKSRYQTHKERGRELKGTVELEKHRQLRKTLDLVVGVLNERGINYQTRYRADVVEHPPSPEEYDLVVSVGGDGTFLEASHYTVGIPMLGVNPNPRYSCGSFCGATGETFTRVLDGILQGGTSSVSLNRMRLSIDGQTGTRREIPELILNEFLFANPSPAGPTWYELRVKEERHLHVNSGLVVSTAAGSTAWTRSAGGILLPLESRLLEYVSREPYPHMENRHPRGLVDSTTGFEIESRLREGVLFIDGDHLQYGFVYGDRISVQNGEPLEVYGIDKRKRLENTQDMPSDQYYVDRASHVSLKLPVYDRLRS